MRASTEIGAISLNRENLAEAFTRDGYAVVTECLSEEDCDQIGNNFSNDCYGLRELLTLDAIQQLARSPQVMSLATTVLGAHAFAMSGTFFNKTPAANWKVPWHQDRMIKVKERFDKEAWGPWSTKDGVIHVQPPESVISKVLAIRLHLDDCPAENGALRVIRGSHLLGFISPQQAAKLVAQPEAVCAVPKGGALLMHPLLLHSSSTSSVLHLRRVIHLEFAADDLPEPFQWRYRVA